MAQGRDEGLRSPVTERGLSSSAAVPAPPQQCHLGRGPGFVDKGESFQSSLHPGLPVQLPYAPGANNVSAIGSTRQHSFLDGKSLREQQPGKRRWMRLHPMPVKQPVRQFWHLNVACGIYPADQNIRMRRQRTPARRATLPLWCDRSRPRLALRQPNCSGSTHTKPPCCCPALMTALNLFNDPNP
jgi:hypothetical protein